LKPELLEIEGLMPSAAINETEWFSIKYIEQQADVRFYIQC